MRLLTELRGLTGDGYKITAKPSIRSEIKNNFRLSHHYLRHIQARLANLFNRWYICNTGLQSMEELMQAVKISPKFQVVIPQRIRESMHLRAGQKMQVVEYGNRIEYVPVQRLEKLRGFVKGIDTRVDREDGRI